ncbi:hypothetical protein E4T50_03375 [Aureobasidium sp. EXF-12298]|nr:hypothetical protein E4T50_03375 [Aureobasidium sp. EXF-12298]
MEGRRRKGKTVRSRTTQQAQSTVYYDYAAEHQHATPYPGQKQHRDLDLKPIERSRADDFQSSTQESPIYNNHLSLNIPAMMASNGHPTLNQMSPFQFRAPRLPQATSTDRSPLSDNHQLQLQQPHSPDKALSTNQHHHHHLPPHSPTLKRTKHGEEDLSMHDPGPPSMVGKEGRPEPAARPKGPKLKFTREDDALLVRLKESKNLTWKQIAEFFPGRSAGTLQVRYCTKLKAKTTLWNDDMIQRLRTAIQDYDNDRWRFISSKVGSGFSAAACKAKAEEIEAEDMREDDGVSPGSDDDQQDLVDGEGVEEEGARGVAET